MFESFFGNSAFMPHIHCYLGNPALVITMVLSDTLIGSAYIGISLTLWALIRKIRLPFGLVIVCFGLFIGACGATHFMEVWTLWHPDYWVAAFIKLITACASVGTGVYLFRLRHVLIDFAESARLSEELRSQLTKSSDELERRVLERTHELEVLGSRLLRVSSATDLGIWYCDLPFDKLEWSKKTKEHFWMPDDADVTITKFYEHIHPDDRARTRSAIEQAIESHKAYDIEYRTINPSLPAFTKWIRAVGWTAYDKGGNPVSFDGITLDLTEKKLKDLEKDLLQADLYDLLERTSDGVFIVDSCWRLTYANPVTREFLGVSAESLVGKSLHGLFPSDDHKEFMRHYEKIVRTGEPCRFERIYEGRILQVHAYRTREDGVAVFYRDATELVEAGQKLKESESRYATLTGSIPQLVWTCLPDGNCNYLSQQWESYTGIRADEQLGLHWLERVIHPDDRARTIEHWMGAVGDRHPYDIEYRIRRFDGEFRWFQTRGTPMRGDTGQILYWVGTCTDIQAQKILAEELTDAKLVAERASEAKTQFLANMSHEIRTPIGAITGFAEMLNHDGHSDSDKLNYSRIIERNSKQLLRIIDDILDLSKVEAGKIAFEDSEFSLNDFLIDFDAVMCFKASEKSVRFVMSVHEPIPDMVIGDQLRLKQVLANIAGNAVKFTDQGEVKADVGYRSGTLTVTVTDSGVGISPEQTDNLFKPFSQADPSLSRRYGGTGLGLVLSKKLANQFGGDVVLAHSEPGRGSTFIITVKLPPAPDAKLAHFSVSPPAEVLVASSPNASGILQGIKVLLVEDSPDNRTLISVYLKRSGATLITAGDGSEGYHHAMKNHPDIVLMDLQMPKMDGHRATQKLRAAGFQQPIIALTAHAMREERERCLQSGFSDYLTKPVQKDSLMEAIAENCARFKSEKPFGN